MKRSEVLKIIDDEYGKFVEDWIKADMDNLQDFVPLNERFIFNLVDQTRTELYTLIKNYQKNGEDYKFKNATDC